MDGRTLVGELISCDQVTNLLLQNTIERIIRPPEDPEASSDTEHGCYLVRGDMVVCVGHVDEELDAQIDWTKVRGSVIGDTKNT